MATVTVTPRRGRLVRVLELWRPPGVSLRSAFHTWQRNAMLFRRGWKRYALPNFLEPLLYLVAIGVGIGAYLGNDVGGVPYIDFIAPGLAASSAMYGAIFELSYNVFVKLRFSQVYDAVVTTPLEPQDIALGEIMWGVTRSFIYGSSFLLVVALLGHAHSWAALIAPLTLPLVGLSMGLLALMYTAWVPDIDLYTYFFNVFIIPLFLFGGIFFPLSDLPTWAQTLAWCTPLYHGVEMNRDLILRGDIVSAGGHALWLVVFSAIFLPPALNMFRRRVEGNERGGA